LSADSSSESDILAPCQVELANLRTALDFGFGAGASSNPNASEDRVVFPLGAATRGLFEEVIWSVHQKFGFGALRTSRTLYECVVFSLYINKHPETWEPYLNSLHAQWANILRNVPAAEKDLPEIHKTLSEKVPKYGTGKMIPVNWNDDATTYKMASGVGISDLFHSLAFGYTSAFVHPSALFFLEGLTAVDGRIRVGVKSQDRESRMALQITHDMTINALRLRLKYSGAVALQDALGVCEEDFSRIWGYKPQLTQ
jgi:Family of unknown function (DUF5677)